MCMFVNASCACVGFIGAGNKTNIPSFLPLAEVNQPVSFRVLHGTKCNGIGEAVMDQTGI